MSEWRPIETAPKDGTLVLLSIGGEVHIGLFTNGWGGPDWYDYDEKGAFMFEPTHWMPIPPPPAEEAKR